jgi:hypothetical protein
MLEVKVSVYLDTASAVRGLVSVYSDGVPVQTIGSALVGSEELVTMMCSSVYALNATKDQT